MDTAWWARRGEPVRVLTTEQLWGLTVALIAVPSTGHLERVPASELRPLVERTWTPDEVAWRAVSGLVWRAMTDGEPLAVARGGVVPLPHQLAVLDRAMSTQPLRLLLADEVGLGKTIEAGLIVSELKARELIRRVLVVAPKGVQLQWIAEMADRFGEEFVLVGPGGVPVDAGIDPWRVFDQVVCSLDAVKPLRSSRACLGYSTTAFCTGGRFSVSSSPRWSSAPRRETPPTLRDGRCSDRAPQPSSQCRMVNAT